MNNLIELEVSDIKNSNIPSEAYALILNEKYGDRIFPIIIGMHEAKSIVLIMNNFKSTRPSTHELLQSLAKAANLTPIKVIIYHYENGIFYANIIFVNPQGEEITLDSRTSDAIAIALLCHIPIFIREETLNHLLLLSKQKSTKTPTHGPFEVQNTPFDDEVPDEDNLDSFITQKLEEMTIEDLQDLLEGAISSEDFELANKIHEEIQKRENKTN